MRGAAAIPAIVLGAGAAQAMPPLPDCYWDYEAGALVPAAESTEAMMEVYFSTPSGDWVTWDVMEPGRAFTARLVAQNCASGQELLVTLDRIGNDAAVDRWDALVWGEGKFTLRQIANEMARFGGRSRIGPMSTGSCACDVMGTYQ